MGQTHRRRRAVTPAVLPSTGRGAPSRARRRRPRRDSGRGPPGRRRTTSRPSARSGDGPRQPGTPCSPATPRRGDWAGGRGARGTPGRGGRRDGAPPRGRRSTRPGHRPQDRSRRGTPRVRGVGRDGDQAAGVLAGLGVGSMQEKGPGGPADQHTVSTAHRRLAVGDLLRHPDHLTPQQVLVPHRGGAHALRLQFERATGARLARKRGVDGEVHARIEEEGMDAGLRDPVRIAGHVRRSEASGDPAQVLPVDAIGREGPTDDGDDRHAAVAQPTVHVLSGAAHRGRPYRARAERPPGRLRADGPQSGGG